ncbi:MAG TPA: glycosyltransferase family 1 protein, partial [Chloroflexota bacterium]|nr:glycosyltransferase family 1 protein [Chloroflexota bacterium]
ARYAREVIAALVARADPRATLVLDPATPVPEGADGRSRPVRAPRFFMPLGAYGEKLFWEQVGFRLAARRVGADVWYSPHFSMPLYPGCPTVISVHDMIPFSDPAYAGGPAARAYFALVARAARQAAAVVTLSFHAKGEIERLLAIPGDRIHVVSPGVDDAFSPAQDPSARARAAERYRLPHRYLLYLGGADARKNIGVLLRALALLPADAEIPPLAIVAGEPKAGQTDLFPDWRGQARRLGLGDRVHFVPRVAEEDLVTVYRGAEIFCFPSRAEGFGLTPLEAMACGAPTICSNATSLPEAVGDAALLVGPDDTDGWARSITRLAGDPDLRADLGRRGAARARTFRWAETGSRVVEIIALVGA